MGVDAARGHVEMKHRVDDRAGAARPSVHHVGERMGSGVKKGLNFGLHGF